mmetsp:Transcript_7391/g.12458  ORF Transcript_7391/g.12458 Transcript_7391/m.12458 type:complete len:97 (-) Transcript_7391:338-628(-)|eukprot:CAMPEP_0119311542 /NCGR_PEP_ID=MMETSP1333-20130426/22843_1 /TAXON_ID=418940 /ORGANISM="Scyphosphaera apsteinii, Strain RCC1455" /LENGTH=96 /DNA_ID=CAMNT_0007315947 /DNA_START=70 /DNA_END=360 /DNA_ORIENTATION=+
MSKDLAALLEKDLPGKVNVTTVPVDPATEKVYKIELDGETYFDWVMPSGAAPKVNRAPNEKWQTPLNFSTHESYFGPGPKTGHIDELKSAILAKAA